MKRGEWVGKALPVPGIKNAYYSMLWHEYMPTVEEIEEQIIESIRVGIVASKCDAYLSVSVALDCHIFPHLNELYDAIPKWNLWRRYQFKRQWARRVLKAGK